ncbi:cytochrome P450 [Hydrogenophaga crassostreae]|uniref:Cytochrome P450 n=2 Tax=Hydrogenophaga crassostreae TaxID=1763535 RepID=A0A162P872_9BURK|nr:cytochrome P450 [Hydrogenophaga crassostreae]OAD42361.1 cytochrome P450 [Hydrogenophaga crassostreae]
MKTDYLGFCTRLRRDHGDISHMKLLSENVWDLMSPDLVREALVTHADHLLRWERGIEVFSEVFGQSVLVTEGATWQRQRRMLMTAFTPQRVNGYAQLMTTAAKEAFDAVSPKGQERALVNMDTLWSGAAMDVILRTLFSQTAEPESLAAAKATQVLSTTGYREMFHLFTLPDWLPLPGKAAKRQALHTLRSLIRGHIDARRSSHVEGGDHADLLGRLLALRDEETGEILSPQEVFDQCMVSFQAGHETSATALLWWSRLMAEHPEAAKRAREEVASVVGAGTPGPEHLPQLPWLTATLKEAMRLYPPVAAIMARRTTAPIELGGWHTPKGAMLRIAPYVLHRDERNFANAEAFLPERFLEGASPIPRGAFMPFGAGPRVCLGQHFAMLEMTLLSAMLLQRFELHLPDNAPRAEPEMHVTLRPKQSIQLWLHRVPNARAGQGAAP